MEIAIIFVWVFVIITAVIIEMHTVSLIGWAAAIGGIGGLVTHSVTWGDPIWMQFVVFAIIWILSWVLLFVFIKPLRKKLHDSEDGYLNYIGNSYVVIKSNDEKFGEIEINDKKFRFISQEIIKIGEKAKVISIKGVTFNVQKEGDK